MEFFLKNVPIYIYIHEKTELSSFKTDAKADYSVFWVNYHFNIWSTVQDWNVFPLLYLAVSRRIQKIHMRLIYVYPSSNYGGQFAVETVRWNAACKHMNLIQRPWNWKKQLLRKKISVTFAHFYFILSNCLCWENFKCIDTT